MTGMITNDKNEMVLLIRNDRDIYR